MLILYIKHVILQQLLASPYIQLVISLKRGANVPNAPPPEQLLVWVPEGKFENAPIGVVVPEVRACIRNPLKSTSPSSLTMFNNT